MLFPSSASRRCSCNKRECKALCFAASRIRQMTTGKTGRPASQDKQQKGTRETARCSGLDTRRANPKFASAAEACFAPWCARPAALMNSEQNGVICDYAGNYSVRITTYWYGSIENKPPEAGARASCIYRVISYLVLVCYLLVRLAAATTRPHGTWLGADACQNGEPGGRFMLTYRLLVVTTVCTGPMMTCREGTKEYQTDRKAN